MTAMETSDSSSRVPQLFRDIVEAPVRGQTYKNLAYLALAFPLGIAYFVGFVTGTALGFGLLITLVGLPILVLTVAGATLVAGFEAYLAKALVGVDASKPAALREFEVDDAFVLPGNGFLTALKRIVTAPSTWTSIVLVFSKFAFGIVSFVALILSLAIGTSMVGAPLIYDNPGTDVNLGAGTTDAAYSVGPWVIDTLPEALVVSVGGVAFVLIALTALNYLARIQALYTSSLMGVDEESTQG